MKIAFVVYPDFTALDLIGAKMLAAQVMYGDEVGGALADELDEGDLIGDLVRKALGDLQVGRAEGIFSLGNDQLVTDSPIGSPTPISLMAWFWPSTQTSNRPDITMKTESGGAFWRTRTSPRSASSGSKTAGNSSYST